MKTNYKRWNWGVSTGLTLWLALAGFAVADRPIVKHPNGKHYLKDEIYLLLKPDFAAELSPPDERRRPVDRVRIQAVHPAILKIKGAHTSAENWLEGKELPKHIKQNTNEVLPIARMLTATLKPGADAAEVIEQLRTSPVIEWAELIELCPVRQIPNDPGYTRQWSLARIHADEAWEVSPATTGINIAIVDTGVDFQNPEFAGIISFQRGYLDNPNGDAKRDGRNAASHGTHVAGIAAALRNNAIGIAGIAQARIMAMGCAVWDSDRNEYTIGLAEVAIADAVDNGARVINCSFGAPLNLAAEIALRHARDNNVLVVAAAGNDGMDIKGGDWAAFVNRPLIVSATDSNDALASFSNYGWAIDIAAPGVSIYSTVVGGYQSWNGTSMASPCVAGSAALVMSMNPGLIEDDGAKHLLYRMAVDVGPPGDDPYFGRGRVNLSRPFLQTMRNATVCVGATPGGSSANGRYDQPYTSIPQALQRVSAGATLVLNGGLSDQAGYSYPAISITTPVTLTALPDKPVTIGR